MSTHADSSEVIIKNPKEYSWNLCQEYLVDSCVFLSWNQRIDTLTNVVSLCEGLAQDQAEAVAVSTLAEVHELGMG